MLGRPLVAQRKEEQRVDQLPIGGGSFNAATRGVLGMSCA